MMAKLNQLGKNNPNWKGGIPTLKCVICGKEFKKYRRKNYKTECCSNECRYKNDKREVIVECKCCGVEFRTWPWRLKNNHGRLCSKSCANKWKSETMSGENAPLYGVRGKDHPMYGVKGVNHPQWKGGKTDKLALLRSSRQMVEWRRLVFEKDDYTCQVCGTRGRELNAHHVLSFADYPRYRFNVDNGVTYCKECHDIIGGILKMGDIFQPLPRFNTSNNGIRPSL